ncbi:hypothetical protein RYH80_17010 [Halobaculum sp. MBLA0147]|uniref:hypothetical protein n=1 Tax=Halobaculum sp. MBLA0147 TaxID=3079934 RepID=UPI0035241835
MAGNTDLGSFGDTPADDAPGEARVCTVATQTDTFERCREGFYPSPQSYDRTRESFEWMAFYRTAPTSAITHYARVTERTVEDRDEPGTMDETDWEELIDPFSEERRVTVFHLGELVPLENPVANDANGVRGAWYHTVDDLRAADTVSDLAARAGETR